MNTSTTPMTFIILEDDMDIVTGFEKFNIDRNDIKLVANTNSSYEAIKLTKKLKPEAIIVDLELSHGIGTGFEFLTELRNAKLNFTPLVIVYTQVKPGIVYDGIHEGYADLVFYKGNTPPQYVINSMLISRKKDRTQSEELVSTSLRELEIKKITELINRELDTLGISHKHNGREYIVQSILLMIEKQPKTPREFSPLSFLADSHATYSSNISRDISTAINYAWLNTPIETLEEHYTAPMQMESCLPTPMEFIYYYYKKIKELLQKYCNCSQVAQ